MKNERKKEKEKRNYQNKKTRNSVMLMLVTSNLAIQVLGRVTSLTASLLFVSFCFYFILIC